MMRITLLLLSIWAIISCSASKKGKAPAETITTMNLPSFKYSTTPCFGFCPVYEIQLKPDGALHLFAKRFVHPTGAFKGQMTEEQKRRYLHLVDQVEWDSVPERYETQIADAPGARYVYEDTISTFGTIGVPKELRDLGFFFDSLRLEKDWERVDSLGDFISIQKNNAAYAYFKDDVNPDKISREEAFLENAQLAPVTKDGQVRLIELYNSDLDYEALKDMLLKKGLVNKVEPAYELKKK